MQIEVDHNGSEDGEGCLQGEPAKLVRVGEEAGRLRPDYRGAGWAQGRPVAAAGTQGRAAIIRGSARRWPSVVWAWEGISGE